MKTSLSMLLGFALLAALSSTALAVEILVDPGAYNGKWSVDYGRAHRGPAVVDVRAPDSATGAHVVSISGAELFFDVDADGTVRARNAASAVGGARKLTFRTTLVKIDPLSFQGAWGISAGATPRLRGVQFVSLVPGLKFYNLEMGPTGGFVFHVGDDGLVTVQNSLAGDGGLRALTMSDPATKR